MLDIVVAEPARVTAKLVRPNGSPPHARTMRGGTLDLEAEFTAEQGFAPMVSVDPGSGMPPGVRLRSPAGSPVVKGTVRVSVQLGVEAQSAPVDGKPAKLAWRTTDGTNAGDLDLLISIDRLPVRGPLGVRFRLRELQCVDEGDGPGTAEPYLWALFFKLDGERVSLVGGKLTGTVFTQRMFGGHGNLGTTDVDAGDIVAIPDTVGLWTPTMLPIPIREDGDRQLIKNARGWDDLPGVAGALVILLEEDSLPAAAALAGYDAMVTTFEAEMNTIIPTLGILNPTIAPDVEEQIKNAITRAVKSAILGVLDLPQKVAAWIAGPDQILGNGTWRFDHDMLVDERAIGFERRWKEGVNVNLTQDVGLDGLGQVITSGGEWILRGSVEVV